MGYAGGRKGQVSVGVWATRRAKDFSPLHGLGAAGLGARGSRFRRPLRDLGCPFVLREIEGRTDSPGPGYGMVFVRGDGGLGA